MEVGVSIGGEVVVDGKIDAFNVDTSPEDVGGDADTLVEFLELFVALDTVKRLVLALDKRRLHDLPLLLTDTRVYCNAREVALSEKLVELGRT